MVSDFKIKIPYIDFTSHLTELIMKLEALKSQYKLAPHPKAFLQLREIFSMLESLQSARIEGNRTTISDYADTKFDMINSSHEDIDEIRNIENAISYVDTSFCDENFKISHLFLKELHSIVTSGLRREGSKESGCYRHVNVKISHSSHVPPDAIFVQDYMDKLVNWINEPASMQELSVKVAVAHHLFTWIHPFDNGNGRMSRVLTYAMLKQYGFDMVYLLNPSAVFCMNRDEYFEKLQIADEMTDKSYLIWCEYVLEGLNKEMKKIIKLMNINFLNSKILIPAIERIYSNGNIPNEYRLVLKLSLTHENNLIKSKDIQALFPDLTARQVNTIINKMIEQDYLYRTAPKGRIYYIKLMNKYLLKSILNQLEQEDMLVL